MAILTEGQRYERNGLFATPETIDDLTAQLNSPEQWVAYGLTNNFLASEFNKVLDNLQIEIDKLEKKCKFYRQAYNGAVEFHNMDFETEAVILKKAENKE